MARILVVDDSPWTWMRGARLAELDYSVLPVPIVGLPWDHIANPWEFLSLHHEVAHDIDGDLNNVSNELEMIVNQTLRRHSVPDERIAVWRRWTGEIVADFLGILLAGPPFVSFLASFLNSINANSARAWVVEVPIFFERDPYSLFGTTYLPVTNITPVIWLSSTILLKKPSISDDLIIFKISDGQVASIPQNLSQLRSRLICLFLQLFQLIDQQFSLAIVQIQDVDAHIVS